MIRKITLFFLFILFLNSCDYKPIYSKNLKNDFSIKELNFKGDIEINNLLSKRLKKYQDKNATTKFDIEVNSTYEKKSQSKDLTGKTTDYKIIIKITFKINDDKTLILQEDFLMKNLTNEFEERKYEKTRIENSIDIIINTFTIQLSQLQ